MALGGGIFTTQNKKLPGAYINFVSAAKADVNLSDRGYAAMPLSLDWGEEGKVITVTHDDFLKNSIRIFGYDYTSEKIMGLRDCFKNAKTLYVYKLNTGVKAENEFAVAKYGGVRGNDIRIIIDSNVDNSSLFDVKTYLDLNMVDSQTVKTSSDLKDNDFVTFKSGVELIKTASTPLANGTNGNEVTGQDWVNAFTALESYSFNTLGCLSTNDTIKDLCIEHTKRLRDEVGVKFQCVVYQKATADNKAVISVENKLVGESDVESGNLVYWVTGASAGCAVNKSCTNKKYDGEYKIDVSHSQLQLENALDDGKYIFHKVGDSVRVLEDINTLLTYTDTENQDFKYNQTIRVLDQIGNDIAVLFNTKYLGIIPNNRSGRIALWNDIVKHHKELEQLQAIEDFESEHVTVEQGDTKKSVVVTDYITVTNAMAQLYMTVTVA